MSTTSVRRPSRCAAAARFTASVVFPLPPFCCSTATVRTGASPAPGTRVRGFLGPPLMARGSMSLTGLLLVCSALSDEGLEHAAELRRSLRRDLLVLEADLRDLGPREWLPTCAVGRQVDPASERTRDEPVLRLVRPPRLLERPHRGGVKDRPPALDVLDEVLELLPDEARRRRSILRRHEGSGDGR